MPVTDDIATADTGRLPRPFWDRVQASWRVIACVAAILGAGGAVYARLDGYATKADLGAVRSRLSMLELSFASLQSTLLAIQQSSAETRQDVRRLLEHMLAYPPRGDSR